MAMIRYRYNCAAAVAGHDYAEQPVEVKTHSGFRQIAWGGFICESGLKDTGLILLGKVKIRATMITNGGLADKWISLRADEEFVLGGRIQHSTAQHEYVLGIVDHKGWPIIVTPNGRRPVSPKFEIVPKGRVYSMRKTG